MLTFHINTAYMSLAGGR